MTPLMMALGWVSLASLGLVGGAAFATAIYLIFLVLKVIFLGFYWTFWPQVE